MATACVWLSVIVKSGHRIVKERTVVKCSWTDKFQDLYEGHNITRVEISKDDKFMDPMVVPLDAPISICSQFQCSYACIFVESDPPRTTGSIGANTNSAFDVMMTASCQIGLPSEITPPSGKELRKDQLLYNDLLG